MPSRPQPSHAVTRAALVTPLAALTAVAILSCTDDRPTGPRRNVGTAAGTTMPELRRGEGTLPLATRSGLVPSVPNDRRSPASDGALDARTGARGSPRLDQAHVRHLVLEHTGNGARVVWVVSNGAIVNSGALGTVPVSWHVTGAGDFNADGFEDLLWENTGPGGDGSRALWLMDGTGGVTAAVALGVVPLEWRMAGAGDYDHDGSDDVVWENLADGSRALWLMQGGRVLRVVLLGTVSEWHMVAAEDLNSDGKDDILLEHPTSGDRVLWLMSDGAVRAAVLLGTLPTAWHIVGSTDVDGDGIADVLLENRSNGTRVAWLENGRGGVTSAPVLSVLDPVWRIAAAATPARPGPPEITLLPSRGASAGRSGFTLYVHGRGFVAGSVVRWNGAGRPTQYVGSTRLTAAITAADVAQPGVAQITVVNPASSGGASAPATMTIRQIGATTVTERQVPLEARDIAFEPAAGRFYASIKGTAATNGNSVVAIDPTTGAITGSAFVGSEPGKLALSGDGQHLYVGLNGANAARRVDLPSLTPALQWALPAGQVAGDMAVMPGTPTTVAVSRHSPGFSPPLEGVTIYDNGVARPTSSPGHTGGNRIEFLEQPSVLYGYNNAHTGFEFFTIAIDASGARHVSARSGLVSGHYTDIFGYSGRIYGTDGSIVDAEQQTKVGTFPGGPFDAVAVNPELGRAYLLAGGQLRVHDLNTFTLLGTVTVPTPSFDHPALASTRLLRWGADGVAFFDLTRLIIVRSPIIGP